VSRFLPYPLQSLAILGTWLALNNTVALGQVLLGAVLALLLPLAVRQLAPVAVHLQRPAVATRLLLRVAGDIVIANLQVAVLIIGPERRLRPAFVRVPLQLADPVGIAILGGIITLTPGTVSCDLLNDGRTLLVHALDVADPEALVATIRARYETPLATIFPGPGAAP
jgi:multicomponent K+:H+ antiporter subunit E